MRRPALILAILVLFLAGSSMVVVIAEATQDQAQAQEKMDLRYHWLWGWQFYKGGKWHNVGMFASELRRAVRDVDEAAEVLDEINMISLGARLASIIGGAIVATNVKCGPTPEGDYECTYGPLYLLGTILTGVAHVGNQMLQGIYFDRAIRIYNKAQGIG